MSRFHCYAQHVHIITLIANKIWKHFIFTEHVATSGDETAFQNGRQSTMLPDMRPETVDHAKHVAKVVTRRHGDYCGNRLLKISFNVAAATVRATNVSKNSIRVLPFLTSRSTMADTTSLF